MVTVHVLSFWICIFGSHHVVCHMSWLSSFLGPESHYACTIHHETPWDTTRHHVVCHMSWLSSFLGPQSHWACTIHHETPWDITRHHVMYRMSWLSSFLGSCTESLSMYHTSWDTMRHHKTLCHVSYVMALKFLGATVVAHRSHCAIMRHHEMLRDNMKTKKWSICRRMKYQETHEANEATVFYKRLASCLAMKWNHSYSSTKSWPRCRLTSSLLRSAIQCITGACPVMVVLPCCHLPLTWQSLNFVASDYLTTWR